MQKNTGQDQNMALPDGETGKTLTHSLIRFFLRISH